MGSLVSRISGLSGVLDFLVPKCPGFMGSPVSQIYGHSVLWCPGFMGSLVSRISGLSGVPDLLVPWCSLHPRFMASLSSWISEPYGVPVF